MKIELIENKVYFNNGSEKKEIHPFWLRERVNGEEYLDKGTQQRLFDPTFLSNDVSINKVNLDEKYLEVNFNDGVNSKLEIDKIASEASRSGRDVSGRGVQINLLKLMEETEVNLFSPSDMMAQMQAVMEIQRGAKPKRKSINTKNILMVYS